MTDSMWHINDPAWLTELQRSLKQLSDLKYALDEASIVAVTDRKGIIQYVNDKFCAISGYSREELLGQDHRIVNSGYHGKAFMRHLWQVISSGKVWHGEIKNRAKEGRYYWVDTTIVPFVDEKGRPYQYLAIRHEVTQLKETEEQLQNIMAQLMQIQEEERRRFSRDLHDGIGQSLFSLKMSIDRMLVEGGDPGLQKLGQQVAQLMEEVRDLSWEMRPSVLDDLGIVPALRSYFDNYERHYGIKIRFRNELHQRPNLLAETTIYRVVQEALTNIGKYAGVSEAYVTLRDTGDALEAAVEDRGTGFSLAEPRRGVGLFSMEERARAAGGELEIRSRPNEGTSVTLRLPKPAGDAGGLAWRRRMKTD